MRGVISAVCAVGAAIALHGCGGGGPSPAPSEACKNPAIDLVTSSLTTSTKLDVTGSVEGIKQTASGTSDGTTKIDMTAWNARIDETSTLTVTLTTDTGGVNVKTAAKTETKIIVDAEKKLVVEWVEVTNATSGKVIKQNCSASTIAQMPAPAMITVAWNAIKRQMQQAAKCGGNDGTYDTWNINYVHHKDEPLPPIPVPDVPKADLTVDMKIQTDANYLLHSESMTISIESPVEGSDPTTVNETSTTTVSQASATGPVAADLDYSSWGKCTAITPPGHEFLNGLRGFKKDGKGTTRNIIMLTLQTALDMQANEQKVVV